MTQIVRFVIKKKLKFCYKTAVRNLFFIWSICFGSIDKIAFISCYLRLLEHYFPVHGILSKKKLVVRNKIVATQKLRGWSI